MSRVAAGLDRLLDVAVLPGYTRLGSGLRRRGWDVDDPAPGSLTGRRVLVTGAAGGMGEAIARGCVALGATTHLLVRSPERGAPAAERIRAAAGSGAGSVEVEVCDVSDLDAVREFAADFSVRHPGAPVHGIVHNAGVLPAERATSAQGHELTLATHVLGPVLLTELLRPHLRAAGDARVVLVSSGGMYTQPLVPDDLEYTRGRYRGAVAYARSKRLQVELAGALQDRWGAEGVRVWTMHPGWVRTPGVSSSLPGFARVTGPLLREPEDGADTAVWLEATATPPPGGTFVHDRRARPTEHPLGPRVADAGREAARSWLWRTLQLDADA